MAYFSTEVLQEVEQVARIFYINRRQTKLWNDNKRNGELRMLTGWTWIAKDLSTSQQGLKTASAAIRNAYYMLVRKTEIPAVTVDKRDRKVLVEAPQSRRRA